MELHALSPNPDLISVVVDLKPLFDDSPNVPECEVSNLRHRNHYTTLLGTVKPFRQNRVVYVTKSGRFQENAARNRQKCQISMFARFKIFTPYSRSYLKFRARFPRMREVHKLVTMFLAAFNLLA